MKFAKNQKTGEFYAAQLRPDLGKVIIVDADKSLDALLTRYGVLSEDDPEVLDPLQLLSEAQNR